MNKRVCKDDQITVSYTHLMMEVRILVEVFVDFFVKLIVGLNYLIEIMKESVVLEILE